MSEAVLHPLFKEFQRFDELSGVSWSSCEEIGNRKVRFHIRSRNLSEENSARVYEFFERIREDDEEFKIKTAQDLTRDDFWFKFAGTTTSNFRELYDSMVLDLVIFGDGLPRSAPRPFFLVGYKSHLLEDFEINGNFDFEGNFLGADIE